MLACLNARLLAGTQYVSESSWDWTTRSRFSVVFLGSKAKAQLGPNFTFLCLLLMQPSQYQHQNPSVASPTLTSTCYHVLPSPYFNVVFRFLIECSGTLHNFCSCSTFYIYTLHFQTSYTLSILPLPEIRAGAAWGPS
jgi:hypothetical protein